MPVANITGGLFIPSTTVLPDPSTVLGPIFIGTIINWMLMGTLIVQVYIFYGNFTGDRLSIHLLVWGLFLLDIVQTGVGTNVAWIFAVSGWNDSATLLRPVPWSGLTLAILDGITAAIVQIFYAWRIWTLKRTKIMRGLAILIVLGALLQGLAAIIAPSVVISKGSAEEPTVLHHWNPELELWLAASFITDIIVTCCMLWILYDAKSRTIWAQSETLFGRLIINTIQSGSVTALCAVINLALLVKLTNHPLYHLTPIFILGKLYSNSLMANLNARRATRVSLKDSASSLSVGMHIEVSHETHIKHDNPQLDPDQWPRVNASRAESNANSMKWTSEPTGMDNITGVEKVQVVRLSTSPVVNVFPEEIPNSNLKTGSDLA